MVDILEVIVPEPVPLLTPTHWLIHQACDAMNTSGDDAERAFKYLITLLREREDAAETLVRMLRSAPAEDVGQRWTALFLMGEIGTGTAVKTLHAAAIEPAPGRFEEIKTCESARDGEILVRTMAVEALRRTAERDDAAREALISVIEARPERAVLIEAVKAARSLGLAEKATGLLDEKDRWMLDIRERDTREIMAEPERSDGVDQGTTPPAGLVARERPAAECCVPRREG